MTLVFKPGNVVIAIQLLSSPAATRPQPASTWCDLGTPDDDPAHRPRRKPLQRQHRIFDKVKRYLDYIVATVYVTMAPDKRPMDAATNTMLPPSFPLNASLPIKTSPASRSSSTDSSLRKPARPCQQCWPRSGSWTRRPCRSVEVLIVSSRASLTPSCLSLSLSQALLTSHLAKRSSVSPRRSAMMRLSSFRLRRIVRAAMAR